MDTTKDIRIAFAEKVVANLKLHVSKGFFGSVKRHPSVLKGIGELINTLMMMKYSYLDEPDLQQMQEHESIRSIANEAVGILTKINRDHPERLAYLRFYRHTLHAFTTSFDLPANIESAVATDVGQVVTTTKHPHARNLLLCKVDGFDERLVVVTNLLKTKSGQLMKLAMVYPAPVMNILSEAQFIGSASREDVGAVRVRLTEEECLEIRKTMGSYLEN